MRFLRNSALLAVLASAAAPPPDFRFKVDVLAAGNMPQPMELELAPDGRIFDFAKNTRDDSEFAGATGRPL